MRLVAEQSVYCVRSNRCISCVVQLAFESLSVIVNALTLLEVGQVSVYRWDEPDAPTNQIKINWYISVPACVDCDPGLLMFQVWGTCAASPPVLSTVPRWVGSSHPEALSVPAKKDQNSAGGSHYILKKRWVAKMQSELCVPTDCDFTSMLCSSWKHQQKCFWQRNSRLQVLDAQVRIVAQLFKYGLHCHYLKTAYFTTINTLSLRQLTNMLHLLRETWKRETWSLKITIPQEPTGAMNTVGNEFPFFH